MPRKGQRSFQKTASLEFTEQHSEQDGANAGPQIRLGQIQRDRWPNYYAALLRKRLQNFMTRTKE